ncbi:unnamed protein product [Bursaphelenchus okinawaensis]|uniref:Aminopeptidase n=1 Tax=Bursaphelenchus okinawaensis TaxID=465554 RepID=A0A811JW49_9BILA|nr:unnamed protein product [Bursaphelenchus okinawaensis]CAG9085695.1 unnamed protein product [Bursaphelenchus okinawaensis]
MSSPTSQLLYDEANGFGEAEAPKWGSAHDIRPKRPDTTPPTKRSLGFQFGRCCLLFSLILILIVLGSIVGMYIFHTFIGHCEFFENLTTATPAPSLAEQIDQDCGQIYPWREIRLPQALRPVFYKLFIHPNLTDLTFTGQVDIDMDVVNDTGIIVLHQSELKIKTYALYVQGQKVNVRLMICDRLQQWTFLPSVKINKNEKLKIVLQFTGEIQKNYMQGLYVNRHTDHNNGTERRSAVTQFEPTNARRVFPCFDEPEFKAVFDVAIVREKDHIARANTHLLHTKDYGIELEIDHFAPTLKMSTYILAFAVLNDFKKQRTMTSTTRRPIEVNLFSNVPNIENQAVFGLDTTAKALAYFETYFNIPFPLQKTDLLALDDFAEGAMENWGLVTFRDNMLLYDPSKSPEKAKEVIALVVCHEIAHQWFGNYVTMKWWNDLWLNEGFANFMEFLCADALHPDWNMMTTYFLDNHLYSTQMDGFHTSHSISTEVEDPNQISSLFDAISYNKGSAILKMVSALTGPNAFQRALQQYLKAYEYNNAEGIDLWNIVQQHANLNVNLTINKLAADWTTQVGYPFIRVSLNEDGTKMTIHNQSRFLYLEEERYPNVTERWSIPVMYRSSAIKVPRLTWFFDDTETIDLGTIKSNWAVANAGANGFYRVLYSEDIYKEFIRQLKRDHSQLTLIDRAVIMNDAFAFVKAGYLSIEMAFDLILYVEEGTELDRVPWVVILQNLRYIEYLIDDDYELLSLYQQFERHLVLKTYETIGWEMPQGHAEKMFQPELLHTACRLEISNCSKEAQERFYLWINDRNSVSVDLQPLVLEEGIKHGSTQDWENLLHDYLHSKTPSERNTLLLALTATQDVKNVIRLLDLCFNGESVRPNILPRVLGALVQNRAAAHVTWRYIRQHRERLEEILGDATVMFGAALKMVIEGFSTEFDLQEVYDTFSKHGIGTSHARIHQSLESVRLNIQWRRLNEKALELWLKKWHLKQNNP